MVMSLFKQKTFLVKVLPIVILVIGLKAVIFNQGWELFGASPLLSGIVTANMFLFGFLLAGVLSDYKESEKLPGELASSLEVLADECSVILKTKNDPKAKACMLHIQGIEHSIRNWLYKKETLHVVMGKITDLNDYISHFESGAHSTTISRMKTEQANVRKVLIRINTIRETSFVSAGYAIAEGVTFFLLLGLMFVRVEQLYEAMFFIGIIAFVLTYVINLIRDLDNPFEYYNDAQGDEVSLAPLDDFAKRLESKISNS